MMIDSSHETQSYDTATARFSVCVFRSLLSVHWALYGPGNFGLVYADKLDNLSQLITQEGLIFFANELGSQKQSVYTHKYK